MQKLAISFHAWAEKANSKNEEEKTHVHVTAPPILVFLGIDLILL